MLTSISAGIGKPSIQWYSSSKSDKRNIKEDNMHAWI